MPKTSPRLIAAKTLVHALALTPLAILAWQFYDVWQNGSDALGADPVAEIEHRTGLWALRRYLYLLMHAEHVAHQADCPSCGTYARFKLVQADALDERARVCCRQCGHEWTIES